MQRMIVILFIGAFVACKEHKPVPVSTSAIQDTAHKSSDSILYYFDYSNTLAFSEGEQKNRSNTFKEWHMSKETQEAYKALNMRIKKKYNFESVNNCGKYMPAYELFLLREPDSVTYVCDGKEYKKVHPRHDSVRKEILNDLHQLSPLYDEVNFRFYDSSGNVYRLGTTMDTLYKDHVPNAVIRKKIVSIKGKLQGVCNWLTHFYNTYDKVQANTYKVKKGSQMCTYVEFDIPLDSAKKARADCSLFRPVIPGLIKRVGSISPDFQRIYLSCTGYMRENHIDTAFNISCNQ